MSADRKPDEATGAAHSSADVQALADVPLIADRPAAVDRFGTALHAELLAQLLRQTIGLRGCAHAVHVDGPWGSGKTSLLHVLGRELRSGGPDWVVVEFDARLHQRIRPMWWAFLNDVQRSAIRELRSRSRGRAPLLRASAAYWALREGRAAYLLPLLGAGLVYVLWRAGAFGGGLAGVAETASGLGALIALAATLWAFTRATSRWLQLASVGIAQQVEHTEERARLISRRFGTLARRIGRPLAVLVHDLDLCEPAYVVEFLDGIQTLWREVPVAYVVAAEGDRLREAYAHGYSRRAVPQPADDLGWRLYGAAFQTIIRIPGPRSGDVVFEPEVDGPAADPIFETLTTVRSIVSALQAAERERRVGGWALRRSALLRLHADRVQRQLEDELAPFLALLEPSPRSYRTYLTWYRCELTTLILEGRHMAQDERILDHLALWTALRTRWPAIADLLSHHPEALGAVRGAASRARADAAWQARLDELVLDEDVQRLLDGGGSGVALDGQAVAALVGPR